MVDIPDAFIKTRVQHKKEMAIINVIGVLLDIPLEISPEIYEPYVTTDRKGVKQLIVQFQNTMYGTMVASLL